ncbi:X-ray repair cross-complementing protein 5 [Geodia barretti]|uniref:X-ray repair cross-complementing protein 5 n=3 Tax=Geodia barretti TaxID=519541 RepID=A0AA35RUM6_GEOBA|nr:X-ray repair cross-complementing protein 5 [Geodia barretti]
MHIGHSFDVSLFYRDIIYVDDDDATTLPDPSENFEELLIRVRSKEVKKRALQRIPLSLGPGLEIGVGVYCLVREAKKPSFVRLDQRSNEELKTQTRHICEDTGTELMPTDIKFYQPFGGEKVVFEKEEVTEMKKFGEPGLTLMGFKPRSRVKKHCYIKPSNFIFPDESVVKGSSSLFKVLLDRCLARDIVAICRYIARQNAQPFFVALVPQAENLGENNLQVESPGFHVVFLPFAEDFRTLHFEESTKANTEQIDKAKDIIKKLTFKYQPDSFENPVLQKHYRYLEAIALEHDEVEQVTDLTEPDIERISRRAGSLLEEFKELVYSDGYDPEQKPGAKRKAASNAPSAKRPRSSSEDVDVEAEARKGNLKKVTVPVLKAYLKGVGVSAGGKKQDLIDAVNEHLGF